MLVRGTVPEDALKTMRRGMRLAEGEDLLPVDVTAQPAAGNTLLQMVLRQGFNRQIRRMCRDLGLTVLRLCRPGGLAPWQPGKRQSPAPDRCGNSQIARKRRP